MKKYKFSPILDASLEDRLALSTTGASALMATHVPAAKASHVVKHPVVTTSQVSQVNAKVDAAFSEFSREYNKELSTLAQSGNHAKFSKQFASSVTKLRKSLAIDANRLPLGKTNVNPALQARVTTLVQELETNKSAASPTAVISAQDSAAKQDVNTAIENEASSGEISLK
jgi:hypothetical protein